MEKAARDVVYIVQHVHEFDDDSEDIKMIGAFTTREAAEQAVKQVSTAEGFRDTPEGFHINAYELDKIHWEEGYITYTYPRK